MIVLLDGDTQWVDRGNTFLEVIGSKLKENTVFGGRTFHHFFMNKYQLNSNETLQNNHRNLMVWDIPLTKKKNPTLHGPKGSLPKGIS